MIGKNKTWLPSEVIGLNIQEIGCHYCGHLADAFARWVPNMGRPAFSSWAMCRACLKVHGDEYSEGHRVWLDYNFQWIERKPKEITFHASTYKKGSTWRDD